MRKTVILYTDEEISKRLRFADMLIQQLIDHNREPILPEHLEGERQELLQEQLRRTIGVGGEGI